MWTMMSSSQKEQWWMGNDPFWKITDFKSCQFEIWIVYYSAAAPVNSRLLFKTLTAAGEERPYQKWKMGHERQPCTVGFLIRKKKSRTASWIIKFSGGLFWLLTCWPLIFLGFARRRRRGASGAFLQWLQHCSFLGAPAGLWYEVRFLSKPLKFKSFSSRPLWWSN